MTSDSRHTSAFSFHALRCSVARQQTQLAYSRRGVFCVAEASVQGTSEPLTLAAVLQCLADAPRLPALDWTSICHSLFTPTTAEDSRSFSSASSNAGQLSLAASTAASGGDSAAVATAVVVLALKHGSMTSHGFGNFLDHLISAEHFSQLSLQLQRTLLIGLQEVLQSLSTNRSTALLATLRTLCSPLPNLNSGLPQHPDGAPAVLSSALWIGLARCLHSAQHAEQQSVTWPAAVVQAAHAAVRELLPQLLPPPVLLPGEQLPQPAVHLEVALPAEMTHLSPESQVPCLEVSHVTWGAACFCLQLMPHSKVSCVRAASAWRCIQVAHKSSMHHCMSAKFCGISFVWPPPTG